MTAAVTVLGRASRTRWLARRRKGLTATDVPALLGVSPWATPLSVWLDKLDPQPWDGNYSTRRGSVLERFLATEWAAEHGAFVERPPMLLAHRDHPLLLCSLDYLAHTRTESVVLECKSSSDWRSWDGGDLPDQYAVQALMQAAITGLPVVVVADVNGRLEVRRIEPDPQWEQRTIPVLHAWWERHIIGATPPPLDPYRDYTLLNRVWLPEPGETAAATPAVLGAVQAAAKLRHEVDVLDRLTTELRATIRAHMQTATTLTDPDTGATLARVNRRGALTVTYKPLPEGIEAA